MDLPSRPGMRRKSSASNLLASFQGSRSNSITNLPSSTTSTPKEWDSGSQFSEASSATALSSLPVPSSFESIRETLNRRLISLAHIRQGHEGKSYWLNTVLLSPYELDKAYNNASMRKRTYKFAVLAMSLSNLFETNLPTDFLRSLAILLNEYEQLPDENFRPKMRNIFRGTKGQKRSGQGEYTDIEQSSYLVIPNMPMPLDYFQVLISFCDILIEVYHKIRQVVGSTPLSNSGMAHTVPPGSGYSISLQSTYTASDPNYSQLFPNEHHGFHTHGLESPSGLAPGPAGIISPPPTWTPSLADTIVKVDGRFKKIINQLLKELDTIARTSIKAELASLDPLLRNMGMATPSESIGGLTFDFDI